MGRIFTYIIIGWLVSFLVFPVSFTFLPVALNTKVMLAVLGALIFGYRCIQDRWLGITMPLLGAFSIAGIFSMICYISTDVNNTADYAYVSYLSSMLAWLAGAYAVASIIRLGHGVFNFRVLTLYLAGVCLMQCVAAIAIDQSPAVKILVDGIFTQGQEFFDEVDRLYGIGAALDTGGIRFSVVLLMIVALLCFDEETKRHTPSIVFLLLVFFAVSVIGNMIARTTTLGLGLGLGLFVLSSGLFQPVVRGSSIRLGLWFAIVFLSVVGASVYLYNVNPDFYADIRFAFEGFFNWVEQGEWRTDSTDKLNREMWIWPEDTRTWLIGSGLFGSFIYGTDIGYCRFILYCGLLGFSVFALFFIYLPLYFSRVDRRYRLLFMMLLLMTFLVWLKVATDIFQFYALFFCLDYFSRTEEEPKEEHHANRILHTGHI